MSKNNSWLGERWLLLLIAAQPLLDTLAYFTQNQNGTAAGYIRLAVMLALPLWVLLKAERKGPYLLGFAVIGAFCVLHVLNGFRVGYRNPVYDAVYMARVIQAPVLALSFIFLQRSWASLIYPWLAANGWVEPVGAFLETCSGPFEPWIVWRMSAHKFPINSVEINFFIMLFCLMAYIVGSLVTYKGPFNLDRMLHRGIYNTDGENKGQFKWTFRNVFQKLIGITPEYTTGDKVISWSVFSYSFVYKFLIAFVMVVIWNIFSPWKPEWWGHYFFIIYLAVPLVAAFITTFWFVIGGVIDLRRLFRDLENRIANPLDNGQVEGSVSLADAAIFSKRKPNSRTGKMPDRKSDPA